MPRDLCKIVLDVSSSLQNHVAASLLGICASGVSRGTDIPTPAVAYDLYARTVSPAYRCTRRLRARAHMVARAARAWQMRAGGRYDIT